MKLSPDVILRPEDNVAFQSNEGRIVFLTDSGFEILSGISQNKSRKEILNTLQSKYEVDKRTLELDLDRFVEEVSSKGILENE